MQISDGNNISFTPGPASRYKWQASGPNPCPRCQELDGQVRTLSSWESSVMPALHKHCCCRLVCVEEIDSGWSFAEQFSHIAGIVNIDSSISHDPSQPGPQHLSKKNRQEAEGAEDIVPVEAPVNKTTYPSQEGPQHLSKENLDQQ
jgi:hypothetical protein